MDMWASMKYPSISRSTDQANAELTPDFIRLLLVQALLSQQRVEPAPEFLVRYITILGVFPYVYRYSDIFVVQILHANKRSFQIPASLERLLKYNMIYNHLEMIS